jgi:probable rRNA maturation factor
VKPPRAGEALRIGVACGGVRAPVSAARLADAARLVMRAEGVRDAMLSLTLLTPSAIARLNRRHLRHRGATDVISFGFAPVPGAGVVGDVYLCPAVARVNAQLARSPVREEMLRLVVHGVLHVLGWDHPEGSGRESSPMWRRQEQLLARVLRRPARLA